MLSNNTFCNKLRYTLQNGVYFYKNGRIVNDINDLSSKLAGICCICSVCVCVGVYRVLLKPMHWDSSTFPKVLRMCETIGCAIVIAIVSHLWHTQIGKLADLKITN